MRKIIISDTSCLILLYNINELDLLQKLYQSITTTLEVANEFGIPLPAWIVVKQPNNKNYHQFLEKLVDKGEASAIALAVETDNSLLIIDDLKARKTAEKIGLNIIGILGVIVDAKKEGIINSVKPILEKIKQTNFRISSNLETVILTKAGEI
ncbi:MAG: DUF3368 domain-containing protein [Sphingobacteriaceae bacterium]|nr:MAG: DUF3368 domain-containing protein [Sphingobacteriaceae bacterium]